VVGRARGNPLALTEFASAESELLARAPAEFARAVRGLPEPARTLLAAAAADETGGPDVVVRAAGHLGIPFGALEPAEDAGLVSVTRTAVGFPHPLARAAAYQGVPGTRRIAGHRALAEAHARAGAPERRVRHPAARPLRAHAAAAPAAGLAGGRPGRARELADEAARAHHAPEAARTASRTRARIALVRAGLELEHGVPQAAGRMLLDRAAACDDPAVRAELLEA